MAFFPQFPRIDLTGGPESQSPPSGGALQGMHGIFRHLNEHDSGAVRSHLNLPVLTRWRAHPPRPLSLSLSKPVLSLAEGAMRIASPEHPYQPNFLAQAHAQAHPPRAAFDRLRLSGIGNGRLNSDQGLERGGWLCA